MDRPILFSAPMVRAILAGTKSQTRRVCKPAEAHGLTYVVNCMDGTWGNEEGDMPSFRCPHGVPGDRLWVRESHWWFEDEPDHSCGYYPPKLTAEDVEYRADGDDGRKVWRPSIHMPRWASRITLEITGVRVERLQDISEADAIAEGIERRGPGFAWYTGRDARTSYTSQPITSYRSLWESINGHGSWDANPWVWVVEFRRTEGGK